MAPERRGRAVRVALAALLAAAAVAGAARAQPPVTRLGSGADTVWILRPTGPVRSVVVFGHGWGTWLPSAWSAWLGHLRTEGVLVVFPRYQVSRADSTVAALAAFRTGVATAFRRLGRIRVPVVAVGKSFGGSVVFSYAAEARGWGVPAPVAVLSIFPAMPVEALPAPPPRSVDVEILVGDRDTVAGSAGADAFWRWLARHPAARKRYVLVRSHGAFVATHESPQQTSAAARAAFWRPLDLLLARVGGR